MCTSAGGKLRESAAEALDFAQVPSEVAGQASPPDHFDLIDPSALRDELIDPPVRVLCVSDLSRVHTNDRKALERIGVNTGILGAANDLECALHGCRVAEEVTVLHQEAREGNSVVRPTRGVEALVEKSADDAHLGKGAEVSPLEHRGLDRVRIERCRCNIARDLVRIDRAQSVYP